MVILPFFPVTLLVSIQFAAAAVALDAAGVFAQLNSPIVGLSPGTRVFLRTDSNWTNGTTQRYTTHDAPSYVASVKPALASDVQKVVWRHHRSLYTDCKVLLMIQVRFASRFNIPFLATGGGHGFATTFGALKNGLEIDLGLFTNVSVDAAASTMTIGGAVKNGDVIEPLYNAGKEIRRAHK